MSVVGAWIVPTRPQPLLAPDQSPGWARLRAAYERAAAQIAASGAERLLIYSTRWVSIIGHQLQADPEPVWTHVDEEFHGLGSIPYRFRMDAAFAERWRACAAARGLQARTVAYAGFPIDTGTVVALTLLNPGNRLPAGVVSCNMYADRAETLVLGKATADAIAQDGRKVALVAVTALSNRMFTRPIDPAEDAISSRKDDEWNRKLLEFLAQGRLEDVSQLARQFTAQANADQKLKAIWWLGASMGQHNRYRGEVLAYEAIWGTGAAVVALTPSDRAALDQEFDEDDVDRFTGDRSVLDAADPSAPATRSGHTPAPRPPAAPLPPPAPLPATEAVHAAGAPRPVGAYPHARRVGDLLYVSGTGPRQPGTDLIPGGPVRDAQGQPLPYDIEAQTRACVQNIQAILEAAGSSLDRVVDVTAFLIDMERDFAGYNRVYAELLGPIGPTRTTLEVRALPTPIAVELKVIARA